MSSKVSNIHTHNMFLTSGTFNTTPYTGFHHKLFLTQPSDVITRHGGHTAAVRHEELHHLRQLTLTQPTRGSTDLPGGRSAAEVRHPLHVGTHPGVSLVVAEARVHSSADPTRLSTHRGSRDVLVADVFGGVEVCACAMF